MSNKNYIQPRNQKGIYHTSLKLLADLMNGEVEVSRVEQANNLISNANRSFALEIKYAEITGKPIRIIESANFVEEVLNN